MDFLPITLWRMRRKANSFGIDKADDRHITIKLSNDNKFYGDLPYACEKYRRRSRS